MVAGGPLDKNKDDSVVHGQTNQGMDSKNGLPTHKISNVPISPSPQEEDKTLRSWMNLEKMLGEAIAKVVLKLFPTLIRVGLETKLSNQCRNSMLKTVLGIRHLKPWAFKMLDASGKPSGGLLSGTLTSFGSYDECINVIVNEWNKVSNKTEVYFTGQYCTVDIRPPLPPKPHYYTVHHRLEMFENSSDSFKILADVSNRAHVFYFLSLRLGLCIPSTCSARDLEQFAQKLVEDYGFLVSVAHCEIYEPMHVNNAQIAVISVISLIAFFVFAATIFDILCRFCFGKKAKENKKPPGAFKKIVLAFSAYTNIGKLLDTRTSLEGLLSLHGIRFVSMVWIICGNIFLSMKYQIFRQLIRAIAVSESFAFQPFLSCTLALDTFFFISGFLATYTVLRRETPVKAFSNPLLLFVHRIYRLIPAHMVVVALTVLFPLIGGGPVWSEILDPLITNCRERWWTNLLFVNNFVVSAEDRCLEHSWYVSCEAQLLFVAVGIILLLKSIRQHICPELGAVACGVLLSWSVEHYLCPELGAVACRVLLSWSVEHYLCPELGALACEVFIVVKLGQYLC
ncbi:nose resistant to fluoxetine protein 6-like [Limulus polyphemus]|uniref:Nose resistant to fluoxetine protein 6-like n=1 Tax=Limulus polyphemus TaxID=6850 RepID=A0ABM1SFL5_LIMPO|nr:nose resistant to fluoxetine protein 6-like [Limulus polyphemus]